MKKRLFLITTCLLVNLATWAQGRLDGLWDGELTYGGLDSEQHYHFQMWMEVNGDYIKGRSYVYLSDKDIVEMEIHGKVYGDWSIYINDIAFIPPPDSESLPPFRRKYELLYKKSIWETDLEGYWQEIIDSPMDTRRELGKIKLQRVKTIKP